MDSGSVLQHAGIRVWGGERGQSGAVTIAGKTSNGFQTTIRGDSPPNSFNRLNKLEVRGMKFRRSMSWAIDIDRTTGTTIVDNTFLHTVKFSPTPSRVVSTSTSPVASREEDITGELNIERNFIKRLFDFDPADLPPSYYRAVGFYIDLTNASAVVRGNQILNMQVGIEAKAFQKPLKIVENRSKYSNHEHDPAILANAILLSGSIGEPEIVVANNNIVQRTNSGSGAGIRASVSRSFSSSETEGVVTMYEDVPLCNALIVGNHILVESRFGEFLDRHGLDIDAYLQNDTDGE